MRTILYHLCRNESQYKKVIDTILEAEAAGVLSPTATYAEAASLPYL